MKQLAVAGVLSLGLLVFAGEAAAASFDCKKAKTRSEKLICATAELSTADEELGKLYKAASKAAKGGDELRKAQSFWLRKVRDACGDAACMLAAYQRRNLVLRATARPIGRTGSYDDGDNSIDVLEVASGSLLLHVHAFLAAQNGEVYNGDMCVEVTLDRQGKGVFEAAEDEDCKLSFAFAKSGALAVDQEGCMSWFGGRASANGSYRRDRKAAPAFDFCYEHAAPKVWMKSGESQ
jgi:uncharacterized protein